jgi:hypothetical protein
MPVETRFSALVQTGLEAHPTFCVMGIVSLFRGNAAGAKERVKFYLYYPSGPPWPVIGRPLPLPFPSYVKVLPGGPFSKNLQTYVLALLYQIMFYTHIRQRENCIFLYLNLYALNSKLDSNIF